VTSSARCVSWTACDSGQWGAGSAMVASLAEALMLTDDCRVITSGQAPYTIVHTNKAWSQLTGFKYLEVANKSHGFLQGPHTEREALAELKAAVATGLYSKVRILNYTKAGDPFFNTLECFPLKDKHGVVTHFCGVLTGEPVPDGSIPRFERPVAPVVEPDAEALEAEAAAQHEAERPAEHRPKRHRRHVMLSEALANSKDAVVLTEAKPPYAITHVNQPWQEMCGYTLEEVEGLTNSILHGPETDTVAIDDLMNNVRRGESASATVVNYKKGGVRFVNQVQVTPVYDEDDELQQFMAMLHEVDESISSV